MGKETNVCKKSFRQILDEIVKKRQKLLEDAKKRETQYISPWERQD